MPITSSNGMRINMLDSSFEDDLHHQGMSKLIFEKCVNQLIRTTIDVTGIDDPMSRVLLHAENRHSIRALDSNDIVPRLKSYSGSYDNAWSDSSLSSSSSSTKESVDSSTPDFPNVVLVFDSLGTDMSDEYMVRESIAVLPRVSKMLYRKPKMELIEQQSMGLDMDNAERYNDIKPDAYGNALGILKRLKEDAYQIDANEYVYHLSTSSRSECTNDEEDFYGMDRQNEQEAYITPFKWDKSMKKKITIEIGNNYRTKDDGIDEYGKFHINKPIVKQKDDDQKKISLNEVFEDIMYSIKEDENSPKSKLFENTLINKDSLTIEDGNDDKKVLIDQHENWDIDLDFNACKDKLISRIMKKTMIENKVPNNIKSAKKKEVPMRRRCKESKRIHKISCRIKDKDVELLTQSYKSRIQNSIQIRQSYLLPKIPWPTLMRDGNVVILGKKVIVDLNDIVESISTTIILRDLGVMMLNERLLISKAIDDAKLKSERLKVYIYKKYPILREDILIKNAVTEKGSIKTSSYGYGVQTKKKENTVSIKTSSNMFRSMSRNKETNSAKQAIWQFKSDNTDSTTLKSSIDSPTKNTKELSNVE